MLVTLFCIPKILGPARSPGLLMGVPFGDPEGRMDHWMSRGARSFMLRNNACPICDRQEVTVRVYPALSMEASVLRDGLEIMQAVIVHVSEHEHAAGDHATCPRGDSGA